MRLDKLDTTRDYGTVFGHHAAKFEQDGVLFDQQGLRLGAEATAEKAAAVTDEGDEAGRIAKARAFLTEFLAGGPLAREAVMKEAEAQQVPQGDVHVVAKDACAKFFSGQGKNKVEYWKLKEAP